MFGCLHEVLPHNQNQIQALRSYLDKAMYEGQLMDVVFPRLFLETVHVGGLTVCEEILMFVLQWLIKQNHFLDDLLWLVDDKIIEFNEFNTASETP
jgi:hypothetical protein